MTHREYWGWLLGRVLCALGRHSWLHYPGQHHHVTGTWMDAWRVCNRQGCDAS